MTDREKLIMLMISARDLATLDREADFLLAHGVRLERKQATIDKISDKIETNIYDSEEIHHNCTVQILRNSITGEQSIGWWSEELPPMEF